MEEFQLKNVAKGDEGSGARQVRHEGKLPFEFVIRLFSARQGAPSLQVFRHLLTSSAAFPPRTLAERQDTPTRARAHPSQDPGRRADVRGAEGANSSDAESEEEEKEGAAGNARLWWRVGHPSVFVSSSVQVQREGMVGMKESFKPVVELETEERRR